MSRWIVFESCVASRPIITQQGLPQGDPGAPLMMTVLMFTLKQQVEEVAQVQNGDIYHPIYMDDRTVVAKSEATLLEVQAAWGHVAKHFHLIENEAKAQFVNYKNKDSSFEVLGTVIGSQSESNKKNSRMQRRMDDAQILHKKISMLPVGVAQRVKDCSTYCRPALAYGWVDKLPLDANVRIVDYSMWRTIGKTLHSNQNMRQVLVGSMASLRILPFMRQIRLLAQRNEALRKEGTVIRQCKLDGFVKRFLNKFGWSLEGGRYRHPLFREGFRFEDLTVGRQLADSCAFFS